MTERVQIVAVLTPAPGKIDALIESLNAFNSLIEANEPGTLEYRMYRSTHKDTGEEQLVYLETYENMEALQAHKSTDYYAAVHKKGLEEKLLAAPLDIKIIKPIGGFALRS